MNDLAGPPPAALKSADEMLAIAHAMEREAAARYAMLADCMRRVDQREIAELFTGLAAEEQGHVDSVERLAERTLHRGPDPSLVRAALPETFADSGSGTPLPFLMMAPLRSLFAQSPSMRMSPPSSIDTTAARPVFSHFAR